jgi:hypothetical protein
MIVLYFETIKSIYYLYFLSKSRYRFKKNEMKVKAVLGSLGLLGLLGVSPALFGVPGSF